MSEEKKKTESALLVKDEKTFNLLCNDKNINKSTLSTAPNH
jgi:hypothetical protein